MKVFYDGTSEYIEGSQNYLKFNELENEKTNLMYYYGIHSGYRMERPTGYKYNVYCETEEPNGFTFGKLPHERGNWDINFWYKILNNCPYTTKWENLVYKTDKFINSPLIFNPKYNVIFQNESKLYPVGYIGSVNAHNGNTVFHQIVDIIKDIPNYRFASFDAERHTTDVNITYYDKLKLSARLKITVAANLLHIEDPQRAARQAQAIMQMPQWHENEAFALIQHGLMPQIKQRILEAGFTKTLVLVLKDGWNVVERWYVPNEHFLYFDSMDDLKNKINECLGNWDHCQKIVDNMYDHCMKNYTIQAFYEKYLKQYDT